MHICRKRYGCRNFKKQCSCFWNEYWTWRSESSSEQTTQTRMCCDDDRWVPHQICWINSGGLPKIDLEHLQWCPSEGKYEVGSTRCSRHISVFTDTSYPRSENLWDYEIADFIKLQQKDSWAEVVSRRRTQSAIHNVHIPRCTQVCTSMHDNINESVMYVYAFKGKSQSDD